MMFFSDRFFPTTSRVNYDYKHSVVVGVGGNVGDVRKRLKNLYMYLQNCSLVSVTKTSPILKNPPFGYVEQKDFYNAVMVIRTSLSPKAFLKFLLHVEKKFKRERSFKNAPRTLDLDIIFYDNIKINDNRLKIPHPEWFKRDSVVLPLIQMGLRKELS